MEKSQEFYNEKLELERHLFDIQSRKKALAEDPGLRSMVMDLLVEKTIGVDDCRIAELQAKIEEKKSAFGREELEIRESLKRNHEALAGVTKPVIEKCVNKLRGETSGLKIERTVLGRVPSGYSMENKVKVLTNEDGIFRVNRLLKNGIESLQAMQSESISRIESFFQETLEEIRKTDLTPHEKIVTQLENERFDFSSHRL